MAVSKYGMLDAKIAGEDLSSKLYFAVVLNTDDTVTLAGNGDMAYGIVFEAVAADRPCTIQLDGIAKVELGATVEAGDRVGVDANGAIVQAASTDWVIGICRKGGAAGEVGEVYLSNMGIEA